MDTIEFKRGFVFVATLCLSVPIALADTWVVTNAVGLKTTLSVAQSNLQADTIWLQAGVYEVDELAGQLLTYLPNGTDPGAENYALTLAATGGAAIIDGNASKQGMRLDAFGGDMGNADITVRGLHFRECRVSSELDTGAGLFVRTQQADVLIEDCRFFQCIASALYDDPHGGGCYAKAGGAGTAMVRKCLFLDNHADLFGGGLYVVGGGVVYVDNCVFLRNDGWRGGGFYLNAGNQTLIRNCSFFGNNGRSSEAGGGIYLRSYNDYYQATLLNILAWSNTAPFGVGADIYFEDDPNSNGTGAVYKVQYCDFFDLGAMVGNNIISNDNLTLEPLFENSGGSNAHLLGASPCIDAGTNIAEIAEDAEGISRPLDGDADSVARCDIGASEYVHPFADSDTDGLRDAWEIANGLDPLDASGEDGASGDPDTDGIANLPEFIADTDPRNAESLLRMLSLVLTNGAPCLSWQGGIEATQHLERCAGLPADDADWESRFTNLPPTPLVSCFVDTNSSPVRVFYRIRAVR